MSAIGTQGLYRHPFMGRDEDAGADGYGDGGDGGIRTLGTSKPGTAV